MRDDIDGGAWREWMSKASLRQADEGAGGGKEEEEQEEDEDEEEKGGGG